MTDILRILPIALALPAGAALGVLFFGGLRLTVRALRETKHPLAVALVSLYVRIAVTGFGFYLVAGGHWERLVVALAGFLVARRILLRRWGPARGCPAPAGEV